MAYTWLVCNAFPWFFVACSLLWELQAASFISVCRRVFNSSNSGKILVGWPTISHNVQACNALGNLGVSKFFPFLLLTKTEEASYNLWVTDKAECC